MSNEQKDLGAYVVNMCMEKGVTVEQLAEMMALKGVTPLFINDVIRNRRAPFTQRHIDRIAEVLNLSEKEIEELKDLTGEGWLRYIPKGG